MISLPDITVPAVTRLPVDQMEMGLDLLRTVHAALQDHNTFIDCDTLLALSGTMFVALDALGPVHSLLSKAHRETPPSKPAPGSLLEVIAQYREGSAAFKGWEEQGYSDEAAALAATYGPAMDALTNWDGPVNRLDEVCEAIRLAISEDAICDDLARAPLRAALIYLEKATGWKEPERSPS
ncbi:hypothetical protein P052_01151 [Brucella melitensis 02-7258]|uniref:hypothetical protein n=1 Tax=Brucella melitensis TaxID=29459 RepID=UPI0003B946EB|nr:hypothetical protein [Brucella melitensis]ERT78121.1 hypothetical protein P052_01151 [Brucella melitensis 02-7258]